jgi:hypothetical protein
MSAVYDRFVQDAKQVPNLQRKWELRHADGSIIEEVLGRLYFDFEANAKYLSFYLPEPREHVEYPERILFDQIRELLSIPDRDIRISTALQSDFLEGGGLVFTGRVYVYSEQPISSARQEKIKSDASGHGYRLVFRSIEYAARSGKV